MASRDFIVADAGGTTTQWRIVSGGNISQYETVGYNAYTHRIEDLNKNIFETFANEVQSDVPVFFYGAGIDTREQAQAVQLELESIFGKNIKAYNDLIGVARSLCGKEEGHVCILGTGANACYYNGNDVNKVGASLGYILGDEGSGTHLGKKLLRGVFREKLSSELIDAFMKEFNITSHQVIQQIYHQPKPNHFIASFAPFIFDNRHLPEIHAMLRQNFQEFFEAFFHNNMGTDLALHFSGSIAFYFADILRQVGADQGIVIKNIVQSPISGLVLYHQQYD